MSNNYQEWEDDEDFDFDDEQPQSRSTDNGNDLVKKLRKAQRIAEKRAKELEAELNTLKGAQRDNVIKNVLAERGLNPKVAKFFPNDIDPTEDALNQWIEEYGDVFGIEPTAKSGNTSPDLATLRQIDAVTANAITPDKLENMFLKIDQASSAEDIINMINGMQ